MARARITITLPDVQSDSIRELVDAGRAGSVSAFVKHAVAASLFNAAGWQTMLSDALLRTGGALTDEERRWADDLMQSAHERRAGKKTAGRRNPGRHRAA